MFKSTLVAIVNADIHKIQSATLRSHAVSHMLEVTGMLQTLSAHEHKN